MNTEVIKIEINIRWKENFNYTIVIYILLLIIAIIVMATIPTPKKIPDLHCKEGKEIVPLKLEQLAACYKGCQFATQPAYNITPIKSVGMRTYLYESCNMKCEEIYQ